MESVYGNKKYLQSLTAGSDFYRCASTIRPMANEYSSYQNTIGRRSTLIGPYTHMSKYSYPTDVSLSSHYGYTSWGLWRDSRNLSSSMYSKKQKNIKSFSILLMSAAFIVVLAVLCVAGLAFYFSTFKADLNDSILVFDCTFRVTRGDVYTTGLKYNNTSAFRQKSQFYEKLISASLEKSGLTLSKSEINDFGDGPTIVLSFRIFLDMRKIKMTINNVEEHIRNAFIMEMGAANSAFKHVKVDADSIEIKRLLDQEVLRSASFIKEEYTTITVPRTLEERVTKKSGTIEKTFHKFTPKNSYKPKDDQKYSTELESDIDMENLPVIQGSFEITKTEADITQKRDDLKIPQAISTLKPFVVSPATIKVKSNDKKTNENIKTSSGEKLDSVSTIKTMAYTTSKPKYEMATAKIEKTDKHGTTTKKIKTNSTKTATTSETTTPPPPPATTTTTMKTTTTGSTKTMPTTTIQTMETTEIPIIMKNDTLLEKQFEAIIDDSLPAEVVDQKRLEMNENIPKLDANLFTSAPVLDKEPWLPINPKQEQIKMVNANEGSNKLPIYPEVILYRNKMSEIESSLYTENPNGQVYYQSFTNPGFTSSTLGIEPLGAADVRPYPLPIDKISIEPIPNFKYLTPTAISESEKLLNLNYDENKFEHLGDGVIAKKPDSEAQNTNNETLPILPTTPSSSDEQTSTDDDVEFEDDDIDTTLPIFNKTDNSLSEENTSDLDLESRLNFEDEMETTEKLNFFNIKDYIMTNMQNETENNETIVVESNEYLDSSTEESATSSTETQSAEEVSPTTTEKVDPTTLKPTTYIEIETVKYTPTLHTTHQIPELYPLSKWEFVNGTRVTPSAISPTKKVFNETLQALVVENLQLSPTPPTRMKVNKIQNSTINLQNLSTIFDTLATKLGIKSDVPSKTPPFSLLNKIKNMTKNNTLAGVPSNNANRTRTTTKRTTPRSTTFKKRRISTTKKTTTIATTTTDHPQTSTTTTIPRIVVHEESDDLIPIMLQTSSESISSEILIGEAEVEVIDPTKYDEILLLSQTATKSSSTNPISSSSAKPIQTTTVPPSLVTLLPVKSNSGIRNFRPKIKIPTSYGSVSPYNISDSKRVSQNSRLTNNNKKVEGDSGSRGFKNKKNNTMVETVVRASMIFES